MNFDFMSKRKIALVASATMLVVSVVSLLFLGINRGLGFTGGVLVEVGFETPVEPAEIRSLLEQSGYDNAVVQILGAETDIVIRVPPGDDVDQSNVGADIHELLEQTYSTVDLRRSDYVGPAVGDELAEQGGLALLVALISIMVYIMFRFTGKFSLGAVAALIHDVLIVVGIFSLMQWTFDLPELAALLAVIGYSLNDTIVVSDRIRENFRTSKRGTPIEIINRSLNQMLGRTLVTSMTTLLVLVALLVAGGEQLRGFASALSIGVVVGTYSSIYVAATMLLMLGIQREDLAIPEKEGSDFVRK
ncbi:MAG: protein translocase subunit SecF [Gammaproteobacteria bacterium]|nr:protein translocase subunit SecF [Gammaproteobacteria bacterium]